MALHSPTLAHVEVGCRMRAVMLGPTLETPRLILRPPTIDDFDAHAAFLADPRATQYLGGVQPRSVAWRTLAALVGAMPAPLTGAWDIYGQTREQWRARRAAR